MIGSTGAVGTGCWMIGSTVGSTVGSTLGGGGWNSADTGFGLLDRTVVLGRMTGCLLEGCIEDCLRVCPNIVGALGGGAGVPE
jgi:hypothetical protein